MRSAKREHDAGLGDIRGPAPHAIAPTGRRRVTGQPFAGIEPPLS